LRTSSKESDRKTVLADAIGNYIDTLTEREFDAPFIALLRFLGFDDIHFIHGPFEFGKDFIAKKRDAGERKQYVFQTKAGDIGITLWNGCRGQIDLLRTSVLAHPNFDPTLPREARFICTGRLVGGATLAAQEYSAQLSSRRELDFQVWDKESLVEIIATSPEIALGGDNSAIWLNTLSRSKLNDLTDADIEEVSRSWSGHLPRATIECAILGHSLLLTSRTDLACYAALCLIRAAWQFGHGQVPPGQTTVAVADTGRSLFKFYASRLLVDLSEVPKDEKEFFFAQNEPGLIVTYPVRCARVIEILGLLCSLAMEEGAPEADELLTAVADWAQKHPGALHPISDRWAVSISPALGCLIRGRKPSVARQILRDMTKWVGDRYDEDNLGLAPYDSPPETEVQYLLSSSFEFAKLVRNPSSYLATIVLDFALIGDFEQEYSTAHNDFAAVGALPWVKEVDDSVHQYSYDPINTRVEPNVPFIENWSQRNGWKASPYHLRVPDSRYLERVGRLWDMFAVSAVLRDRHFVDCWYAFVAGK
jgi:hypothetical protein